jgi:hypothetical protein
MPEIVVGLNLNFFLCSNLTDDRVLLACNLCDHSLLFSLFFRHDLLFKIFIGSFNLTLGVLENIFLLVEELSAVFHHFDLYLDILQFHMHFLNLRLVFVCLADEPLKIAHAIECAFFFSSILLELGLFLGL